MQAIPVLVIFEGALRVLMQAVQAVTPNSSFDWGMLTALCAVIGLGGAALSKSIGNEVRSQLQEQDKRMKNEFANRELIAEQHANHDTRIRTIEDHLLPSIRRSHS